MGLMNIFLTQFTVVSSAVDNLSAIKKFWNKDLWNTATGWEARMPTIVQRGRLFFNVSSSRDWIGWIKCFLSLKLPIISWDMGDPKRIISIQAFSLEKCPLLSPRKCSLVNRVIFLWQGSKPCRSPSSHNCCSRTRAGRTCSARPGSRWQRWKKSPQTRSTSCPPGQVFQKLVFFA